MDELSAPDGEAQRGGTSNYQSQMTLKVFVMDSIEYQIRALLNQKDGEHGSQCETRVPLVSTSCPAVMPLSDKGRPGRVGEPT